MHNFECFFFARCLGYLGKQRGVKRDGGEHGFKMWQKVFGLCNLFEQSVLDEMVGHDHKSSLLEGLILALPVIEHHFCEKRVVALNSDPVYVLVQLNHLYLATQHLPIILVIPDILLNLLLHIPRNTRSPLLHLLLLKQLQYVVQFADIFLYEVLLVDNDEVVKQDLNGYA